MKLVTVMVLGAGCRGTGYAEYAGEFPDRAKIVAVAEPREPYRRRMAETYGIGQANVMTDWVQAIDRPRLADAVLICMPDALHARPAIEMARKGYHILLEKPMAPTADECRQIVKAVKKAGITFAVGHVMRYTRYTRALKKLVDAGAVGEVVSIHHLEPVGWWHQAHSYTRGNWRNEAESSNMLLAKSCHDLDWISHVMKAPCLRVSSFGSLYHLKKANQPAGAASRCLDCPVETNCAYSAKKIYLGRLARGHTGWPVDVLTPNPTVETITRALRDGPYGRCVYDCDNDVVDHQVVNMEFQDGLTATFTMTGFNQGGGRKTNVFGTKGEIYGDGSRIELFDFLTDARTEVDLNSADASILGGHGGGDFGLIHGFISALGTGDRSHILSGPDETLESHLMVFAAERARKECRVVEVSEA